MTATASAAASPGNPPRTASVRVRDLSRTFGQTVAVDGVSLEAPAGQFTCLIGPSGCGKTTLLRLLAGLETPTAGAIEIDGRDVSGAAPVERGMGMVFQSYALFPNMTVAENIAFGMKRGLSAAARAERVQALLDTVGLPGLAQRAPTALSGGQQQRVAIARALATDPRILLLDEPLAALDPQIREQLRAELKALQRRLGMTTVMVTHDQAEALAVADRIVVMRQGRIEQEGSPQDVYDRPANAFVAAFVGAANLIPAEVTGRGTVRLWGRHALPAATGDLAPGMRGTASIRPELVQIAQTDEAFVPARIISRQFAGATLRFEARPEGVDDLLILDLPASASAPAVDELVRLALPAARLLVFPADGASA